MDEHKFDDTVSDSIEESIRKAMELVSEGDRPRTVTRPEIKTAKMLLVFFGHLVSLALISLGLFLLCDALGIKYAYAIVLSVALMTAVVALNLKRLAVGSILLYQRFAPEKLRASCRFTPSCSEYTLLAIEKYGVIKGVGKGIKRIRRCHPPNGGVDLP